MTKEMESELEKLVERDRRDITRMIVEWRAFKRRFFGPMIGRRARSSLNGEGHG